MQQKAFIPGGFHLPGQGMTHLRDFTPVPTQVLCLDEGILQALSSSRSKGVGVGQKQGECAN